MLKYWKVFLRVLKAYSIEEKILSIMVVIIVLSAAAHALVEFFRAPGLLAADSYYSEGVLSENPVIINPVYADLQDSNRDLSSLVFSGLAKYDPYLKAFVEDLAELTILEDKKTYRFRIKDNIFWHDGEKLTVDDVYFTYHDIIQNEEFQNPVLKVNFEGVKITIVDSKTIDFTLKTQNSFFITNFNVGILPKHLLKDVLVADLPFDNFNLKPVGTGPYKVNEPMEAFSDGRQRVVLYGFDKFYGQLPKIKTIKFYVYPDPGSLLKEKNIIDVIAKVPRDIVSEINSDGRFNKINYQLPQYTAVFINMESPILKKYKVRLALQKSLDKSKLLDILDNKVPIETPLLDLNQGEWAYRVNLEEARGALFDSGYKLEKDSKDSIRKDAKGNVLSLTMLAREFEKGTSIASENEKLINYLKESWKSVGVDLIVKLENSDNFNDLLSKREYDLILTGQSLGYNYDTYAYWHSSQANENGVNIANYKSFAADSIIEKIRNTFDNKEKEGYLKQLASVFEGDIPAIYLFRPNYVFAYDKKIRGFILENLAYIADRFSSIAQWCINC